MAGRVPANKSYYSDEEYSTPTRSIHDKVASRVIAAGGVEVAWFAASSVATSAFIATRKNDVAWSLGTALATFFVAGGAREDSTIRDLSLGAFGGAAAVLTIRAMRRLKLAQGQQ